MITIESNDKIYYIDDFERGIEIKYPTGEIMEISNTKFIEYLEKMYEEEF